MSGIDGIRWHAGVLVEKYSPEQTAWAVRKSGITAPQGGLLRSLCGAPEDGTAEADGNLLVTVGLAQITKLLIGAAATALTNAQCIVGVGTSTTAAAVGDTALGSNGTTAWYQGADATYPQQSNGVITVQSTVASANGNFAWNEWCLAAGTGAITPGATLATVATSPTMWNHKVQALGTKASGGSWVLTATITIALCTPLSVAIGTLAAWLFALAYIRSLRMKHGCVSSTR